MKFWRPIAFIIMAMVIIANTSVDSGGKMTYRKLSSEEERVIINKGTERPFTGQYLNNKKAGVYECRRCGADLYSSGHKFDSGCGWPSFDDEIPGAVTRVPDADGQRIEIVCARCGGHLGHVFEGENFTPKNTRHCVNSVSMHFREGASTEEPGEAIFAGGCFWGVEHLMRTETGVIEVISGYIGGAIENPSYEQVCSGTTGHLEAVKVKYNPEQVSFERLARLFFEIHDFTQKNGQGPDIGEQYLSAIFYQTEEQKQIAEKLIALLDDMGYQVATTVRAADTFWPAEDYHQQYYTRTGKAPYCHSRRKVFKDQ